MISLTNKLINKCSRKDEPPIKKIGAQCQLVAHVQFWALYLAGTSIESRRVHSVDFMLVPLLNVLPLELERGRHQTHVRRPNLCAQFYCRWNFKPNQFT
jgi:hypothetical protein